MYVRFLNQYHHLDLLIVLLTSLARWLSTSSQHPTPHSITSSTHQALSLEHGTVLLSLAVTPSPTPSWISQLANSVSQARKWNHLTRFPSSQGAKGKLPKQEPRGPKTQRVRSSVAKAETAGSRAPWHHPQLSPLESSPESFQEASWQVIESSAFGLGCVLH